MYVHWSVDTIKRFHIDWERLQSNTSSINMVVEMTPSHLDALSAVTQPWWFLSHFHVVMSRRKASLGFYRFSPTKSPNSANAQH